MQIIGHLKITIDGVLLVVHGYRRLVVEQPPPLSGALEPELFFSPGKARQDGALEQARFQDARRRLRDAYTMSIAFPGMVPAYEGNDSIEAFVRNEIGLELPVEFG